MFETATMFLMREIQPTLRRYLNVCIGFYITTSLALGITKWRSIIKFHEAILCTSPIYLKFRAEVVSPDWNLNDRFFPSRGSFGHLDRMPACVETKLKDFVWLNPE